LVACCNPTYSGGKDKEDCGWRPAWENSSKDHTSKNPSKKANDFCKLILYPVTLLWLFMVSMSFGVEFFWGL
jgi:hypothetical protein